MATSQSFPFLDLCAQYQTIKLEIDEAIARVMQSQQFILGTEVQTFEEEIAKYCGCAFAVACASGSDALLLALMALGVRPNREVITTPFTFVATVGSIARLGARPVFADIDPTTFNLDPDKLKDKITSRTQAIIPVHLFGAPVDMNSVQKAVGDSKVRVVEDAAQAIGTRYYDKPVGSFGACGCFSFFPSKNLGGAGDGGLLTTNDFALAEQLRVLRNHGSLSKYKYEVIGINSRLDALQAAILRVKLQHLDSWSLRRRQNAARYSKLFRECGLDRVLRLPVERDNGYHVYNQYVIRAPRRDDLRKHLVSRGVPSEIYYPAPLHLEPAFSYLGYGVGDFPEAEAACQEVIALPIFPELSPLQQNRVVEAISEFYRS
jgi:dTDP-4-amino-4,6-dideoxygalactose transaminase